MTRSQRPSRVVVSWVLATGACVAFAAPEARAQTVTAVSTSAETGAPLVGAVVRLLDPADRVVRSHLSDERGLVRFFRFPEGVYRVRVEMVGMETHESEPFAVRGGASLRLDLELAPRPIRLDGLDVEVDERCRLGPEQGLLTAQLWDEARKALESAELADEQRLYRFQTMIYERDLDRDGTVSRERMSRREASLRIPFRSRAADELVERGFFERSGQVDLYFAPDAGVLLSEEFLSSHCFRTRLTGDDEETRGLVGLAFEPAARRPVVDVAGTLWLEPQTAELQWLEYRYEGLEPDLRADGLGGRVDFERGEAGGWIIPEWWIRMPSPAMQRDGFTGRMRRFVGGYRVAGGMVLDVQAAGRPLGHRSLGGIDGIVRDGAGSGLADVRVSVLGTQQEAVTDSTGSFTIRGLLEGVYRVAAVDPAVSAVGYAPEPVSHAVFNGEVSSLEFELPSVEGFLRRACGPVPPDLAERNLPMQAFGTATLFGWVRDAATDEPLPNAVVQVFSYRYDFRPGATVRGGATSPLRLGTVDTGEFSVVVERGMFGREVAADEQGLYRACWLPERELLTVVGILGGTQTEADTLTIMEDAGVRSHVVRIPRRPGG